MAFDAGTAEGKLVLDASAFDSGRDTGANAFTGNTLRNAAKAFADGVTSKAQAAVDRVLGGMLDIENSDATDPLDEVLKRRMLAVQQKIRGRR